ncbi:hypothetical protein L915_16200 [Phytophthora nicotianae]|uniref:Uncharacterized protein n=1 Tax=Phytophthora nicotianae TaxID=4792 RepID=W2G3C5_PHYNI|nr:hypothetical protein L915_16200 [Phytophthora nicotianae]
MYVAERSGNSEQRVLQCLCKSAPAYVQRAILTRLNSQRTDHLQQAAELVSFAIEYEANTAKHNNTSGSNKGNRGGLGRGGRAHSGGHNDQSGRGSGLVAHVEIKTYALATNVMKSGTCEQTVQRRTRAAPRQRRELRWLCRRLRTRELEFGLVDPGQWIQRTPCEGFEHAERRT